ncbi:MAG: 50S ribosomal protein L24 [bacterium]|nr:50S ribosomal protein L24 [Bacilli bacterium]MDD5933476.1 50S ribosomal protein L24 [bacterium]MDD7616054.1 50S ribosomal protein L24 [bacterium]MDY4159641.1 50S ribosomal protein L24 [Candidatus Onthovivens sp.]
MKLKKGDKVIVISGKDKGSIGTIQKVFPKENRVIVDGVNVCKKHVKPNQMNPEGSIQEIFAPIDASNVMFYDEKSKKGTRLGYKEGKDGKKVRFMKSSKKEVK